MKKFRYADLVSDPTMNIYKVENNVGGRLGSAIVAE